MLGDIVCLPLLEAETQAFVRVIFVIGLILVVLDTDEVRINCGRVKTQADKRIDGGLLVDSQESPALLVAELDQVAVVDDDLVSLVDRLLEELRQGEPLTGLLSRQIGLHTGLSIPLTIFHRSLA